MVQSRQVTHVPGIVVDRIEERNDRVEIIGHRLCDGEPIRYSGNKVFLAAGLVESARIMLESMEQYDVPIRIHHSDRFMLPLIRFRRHKGAAEAALHTMCQAFLEIADHRVCERTVHLQAYTYNDLYVRALEQRLGNLTRYFRWPIGQLAERLIVLFGYLHSDVSSHLSLSIARGTRTIHVTGHRNAAANRIARRVFLRLLSRVSSFRAFPSPPKLDPPGGGNHTGGSFPMSVSPVGFQSDIWGRVAGFRRVHLVDSSVLSSVPGSTISLTIMANAHRIASECPL
jgi:choline dehydrogenase-like flavoprotein